MILDITGQSRTPYNVVIIVAYHIDILRIGEWKESGERVQNPNFFVFYDPGGPGPFLLGPGRKDMHKLCNFGVSHVYVLLSVHIPKGHGLGTELL